MAQTAFGAVRIGRTPRSGPPHFAFALIARVAYSVNSIRHQLPRISADRCSLAATLPAGVVYQCWMPSSVCATATGARPPLVFDH